MTVDNSAVSDRHERFERLERLDGFQRFGSRDCSELGADEVALLRMLATDMTEAAIARQLGASTRTIGRRLAGLHAKLGARNRFELGAEAARRGIV